MRRTFYHGVLRSITEPFFVNDQRLKIDSVVSFDIPVLNEMSETFVIFCLLCLWYICCLCIRL